MSPPQRIVSLLSSATEILFALGVGERVVGVSHECDFPADVSSLPRVTHSHIDSSCSSGTIDTQVRQLSTALYEVDRQQLLELRPQLIVTQSQCDVCAVRYQDVVDLVAAEPLLADTQVVSLHPCSLEDVFADILRVGRAAVCTADAERLVERLRGRVAAIQSQTAQLARPQRPRVACIEWIEPLMLAANWMPELVELAGGRNALTEGGRPSDYARWEEVTDYDPEVLIVMPCGFSLERGISEAESLRHLPGWPQLTAVRRQRTFVVDGNAYFNRSGPRLVDSLEIMAQLLHPDLFTAARPEGTAWQRIKSHDDPS